MIPQLGVFILARILLVLVFFNCQDPAVWNAVPGKDLIGRTAVSEVKITQEGLLLQVLIPLWD
jgi:hypothetical protein